jgi:hypothetical protein
VLYTKEIFENWIRIVNKNQGTILSRNKQKPQETQLTEMDDIGLRYYSNPKNRFVELKMREDYIELEIELLSERRGISLEEFKYLYKKARKHKL